MSNAFMAAGGRKNKVSRYSITWTPYDSGALSYSINIGTKHELYKTGFPVHNYGGPKQSGTVTDSFSIGYSYNPSSGVFTVSVPNRYILGNTENFDVYVID